MATSTQTKPTIVGLYGVPGSGKSFLLGQLKDKLGESGPFRFFEGSEAIADVVPGGLEAFKASDEQEKLQWRQRAIESIAEQCAGSGKVGIVTGHCSFWPDGRKSPENAYTEADLRTYTHILYLDIPAGVVAQQRKQDVGRARSSSSFTRIHEWQGYEQAELSRLCLRSATDDNEPIIFGLVSSTPSSCSLVDRVLNLLHDIRHHSEEENARRAKAHVDEIMLTLKSQSKPETMLVLDADRTLSAADTGILFWKKFKEQRRSGKQQSSSSAASCYSLKTIFSGQAGYSYAAFRQAAFLYQEVDADFERVCDEVAAAVTLHPEFATLLRSLENTVHAGAVVVTCGLRRVWEKILQREGFFHPTGVRVIGGGRIADGYVVTPETKADVVARLREHYGVFVWAFGDSPTDIPMLKAADEAVVVVGEEALRSKSMNAALLKAIADDGLRARQALVPKTAAATPRLTTSQLPLVDIADRCFIEDVSRIRRRRSALRVLHATDKNAAKILMTPTRDASVAGPVLRAAHHRVGWYLATEYLTEILGVEAFPIPHVQGHTTEGHRLLEEDKTVVVALMRGGEPMALGVSEAFPRAMFLHAREPGSGDIGREHLGGKKTVVLVDSVVNSGKSVGEFIKHVRRLAAGVRIVVVAGVVQKGAVSALELLACHGDLSLVALRLSGNKFTGRGGTDTGNRLFNTTHLG